MLNIDNVYLACGVTDLRRNIDGLILIVQTQLKLDPFEKALKINIDELRWILKGYEVRTSSKFKQVKEKNYY